MFDDKENWIGVLFLLVCGGVAGALIWQIVTGNQLSYDGPLWLTWVLGVVFFGGIGYGMWTSVKSRREGGGQTQWPNPSAGRKSLWDRLRGR